jgi:hypothetical protein
MGASSLVHDATIARERFQLIARTSDTPAFAIRTAGDVSLAKALSVIVEFIPRSARTCCIPLHDVAVRLTFIHVAAPRL